MLLSTRYEEEQEKWFKEQVESITDEVPVITPSEWAESRRYLSKATTSKPGMYRFSVAPYLLEIVDNFSIRSSTRFVAFMKGVQVCATVGVLENVIGYNIDHVKSAPCMMVTADGELAKLRLNKHIKPMIRDSELTDCIASSDEGNTRKTGSTDELIEWVGGGFLYPLGAKNADKLRSIPIQFLLRDECSSFPTKVGKDGDPMELSFDRTASFEATRKVLDISTPTVLGGCNIHTEFLKGDQRYYYVPCLKCDHYQPLRFSEVNKETGERCGIVWDYLDNGHLDFDSVRYVCVKCGHAHINDDKKRMLPRGKWVATADPIEPNRRSYHLNALYSPVGMQTWAVHVQKWLAAWDVKNEKPRDINKLQVFYNNTLGQPFEVKGNRLKASTVSKHKRNEYKLGEIPNKYAMKNAGSHILCVTMAIDIQHEDLQVAVFGWTFGFRRFLIDHYVFKGSTKDINNPETWGKVYELLSKVWTADDGKRYAAAICLVDSGDGSRNAQAYNWCKRNPNRTFPIKGRPTPKITAQNRITDFQDFKTKVGTTGYGIFVDIYKDNLNMALEFNWDGLNEQPEGHFNAPHDLPPKIIKQLAAEEKKAIYDGDKIIGYEWDRGQRANELWDLTVYNTAALDILAYRLFASLKQKEVNWNLFWRLCVTRELYYAG